MGKGGLLGDEHLSLKRSLFIRGVQIFGYKS